MMKTAKDYYLKYVCNQVTQENIIKAINEARSDAIKEDRQEVVKHVKHVHRVYDATFKIDKNSIINAPYPEIK